jgi:hypothetical protein
LALGLAVTTGCLSFREHAPDGGSAGGGGSGGGGGAAGSAASDGSPPETSAESDAGDAPMDLGGDAGDAIGQVLPSLPPCSDDGWCWESPLPQGNDLNAVWGPGPGSAWTVGEAGTILYWTGARWAGTSSGTTQTLNGVWGTGPSDAWAVGNAGTLLHWNGSKWRAFSSPTTSDLKGVWSSSPDDTWVVGAGGSILHWDGQWAAESPPDGGFPLDLTKVWGSAASDVWFGGSDGVVRWKDHAWTGPFSFPDAGVHCTALGGSSVDNVIAAAADQAGKTIYIYRWTGSGWGRIYQTSGPPMVSVSVLATNAITVAGANLIISFDGVSWKTQFSTGIDLRATWLGASGEGWVVGKSGEVIHSDGTAWTEPAVDRHTTLTDIWANASTSNTTASDGGADAGDGGSASVDAGDGGMGDGPPVRTGPAVWVSGFDPAAAAGHGGTVWRRQQGAWDVIPIGTTGPLWSIWSADGVSLWAAGDALLNGDASGAPWTIAGPAAPYRRVRGLSPTSVWSVEKSVHFSNRMIPWTQDGSQLWGLLVFGDYDVWTSSASGGVFHWSADPTLQWRATPATTPPHALYALAGVSTKDVWAVGDAGAIRHWNGSQWSDVPSGTMQPLHGVWAKSTNEAWAVGGGGTILKWDGTHWTASASGTNRALNGIVADASGTLFVVGEQATILRRSP